ncbi:hypothetical protein AX15_004060 [Amanita polypyramis BW_CC]|nr:hypothetical protein AX15_004060 [Amanita polypyramis BW_CC]
MWSLYTKDPAHWVPIQTIASFKRMREFESLGVDWVARALQLSDSLEVDQDGANVRRKTEVTEPKDQFQRSIYVKGIGEETSTLQAELEDYFDKFGRANAVRMRRDQEKKFKGSVFVEFADFSTVEKFLNQDPKPTWNGAELLILSKEAYCNIKIKEKGLKGKAAETRKEAISSRGFNAFRLMGRDQGKGVSGSEKEVFLDFLGHNVRIYRDGSGTGTVKEEEVPFVCGATLRFDGCGGDVSWSDIKEPLKQKFEGKLPFIKYTTGDDFGLVGFHKVLSEEDIAAVKETVKTINSNEVTWSLPNEASEKAFQIERAQTAARSALSQSDRGHHKGGRGGRSGRGGRGRGGRRDGKSISSGARTSNGEGAKVGDKRKHAVEPDGATGSGSRGNNAPPTLQTTKKIKTEDGEAKVAKTL